MPHTLRAFLHLENSVEEIKRRTNAKSLLYVGWRSDCKPWWHDKFCKDLGIEKIGVLEIYDPNFKDLEHAVYNGRYNVTPILGDVSRIHEFVKEGEYDIIFWDHGPEHVDYPTLQKITPLIFNAAGRAVLYCCPWGYWPQGKEGGNDHEEHKTHMTVEQLEALGFEVTSLGGKDQVNEGELVGIKVKNG